MRTLGKIAGCVLLAAAACARPDALPEGTRIAVSASQVTIPVSAGGYSSRVGVELRNSGSGVLVPPTTEVRYPGPSGWLRPNLYVRDQDYFLGLDVNAASLPVGTYYATVVVESLGAINSPVAVGVTCVVEAPRLETHGWSEALEAVIGWTGNVSSQELFVEEAYRAPHGDLTFSVSYASGAGWLQIEPGEYEGRYLLSPRAAGLVLGTYQATVTVSATGAASVDVPVTLVVSDWGSITYPDGYCEMPLPLDEERLLCGAGSSAYSIWDPFTGERTYWEWPPGTALSYAFDATLLAGGQVLVTGPDTDNHLAWLLFNPAQGELLGQGSITEDVGMSVVPLADGRALLFGGFRDDSRRTTLVFDPAALTLARTGDQVKRRPGAAVVRLADGRVLAAGGSVYQSDGIHSTPMASAELYDPGTGRWSETGYLATARGHAPVALLPGGQVLVAGGVSDQTTLASAELLDPVTGTWSSAGTMPHPHGGWGGRALRLPDGTILVTGRGDVSSDRYDPVTGRWSAWADLPATSSQDVVLLRDFVFAVRHDDWSTSYRRAAFP